MDNNTSAKYLLMRLNQSFARTKKAKAKLAPVVMNNTMIRKSIFAALLDLFDKNVANNDENHSNREKRSYPYQLVITKERQRKIKDRSGYCG